MLTDWHGSFLQIILTDCHGPFSQTGTVQGFWPAHNGRDLMRCRGPRQNVTAPQPHNLTTLFMALTQKY